MLQHPIVILLVLAATLKVRLTDVSERERERGREGGRESTTQTGLLISSERWWS